MLVNISNKGALIINAMAILSSQNKRVNANSISKVAKVDYKTAKSYLENNLKIKELQKC